MYKSMSIKNTIIYSQTSSKLLLEGLPDLSLNQVPGSIGILSAWRLTLVGSPELEGKIEHLKALSSSVLAYARFCLSGSKKTFSDSEGFITISPNGDSHEILLKSSKPGVKPLSVLLDDAELSDLVRCLDSLRNDSRVHLNWELPLDQVIGKQKRLFESFNFQNYFVGLVGVLIGVFGSLVWLSVPAPFQDIPNESINSNAKGSINK